jgi:death-on-curing protein
MPGVEFLEIGDVLEIHADQIQRYGGADGLRDAGLLASAVAAPRVTFDGHHLHEDLAAMAAAYLFHITCNHAFVDGNKRTGTAAALVFLDLNGMQLSVADDQLYEFVMRVAQGDATKPQVTDFIRAHLQPIEDAGR